MNRLELANPADVSLTAPVAHRAAPEAKRSVGGADALARVAHARNGRACSGAGAGHGALGSPVPSNTLVARCAGEEGGAHALSGRRLARGIGETFVGTAQRWSAERFAGRTEVVRSAGTRRCGLITCAAGRTDVAGDGAWTGNGAGRTAVSRAAAALAADGGAVGTAREFAVDAVESRGAAGAVVAGEESCGGRVVAGRARGCRRGADTVAAAGESRREVW